MDLFCHGCMYKDKLEPDNGELFWNCQVVHYPKVLSYAINEQDSRGLISKAPKKYKELKKNN